MNRLNELLTILQEECAEVSQCASKCIRFGVDATYEGKTNRERLEHELGDLLAMVKLIDEESPLNADAMIAHAEAKLIKVEGYMNNPKNKPKKAPRRKSLKSK